MSKKTFISNQELELTQKIQLQFPRGIIPSGVLEYWENCPPDVLRIVLKDAFYFLENANSPIVKVRKPIPFKLPHNEKLDGRFYFNTNGDDLYFDVRDIETLEAEKINSEPKEFLSFYDHNQNSIIKQLSVFQLWAIYLRGYDFFLQYFQGTVYAIRSTFVVNNDIYFPGISIDYQKERSLKISWYSAWNKFGSNDFVAYFKN